MTDWNEHEDAIDDAISDSIDMDWTSRTGAKAVVAWLNENAAAPAPSLAGGISREQVLAIVRQFASPSWCSVDRLVDTLLAAIAPEAPAEEAGGDRMSEGMPVCGECGGWGEHISTCVRGGFRAQPSAPEARS